MPDPAPQPRGRLPRIRGTQIGLDNPAQVDQIKADMRAGRYAYHELRGQVTGVRDPRGTYHVKVGHHRMAAALEIYSETGDPIAVLQLIRWGFWDDVDYVPIDSRPMPARGWWGAFRNWLGL